MSRKPVTHWTIDELKKTVARKLDTAKKYQPGPKRQKLLRDAKRYQRLLETKKMDFEWLGATYITLVLFVLFVNGGELAVTGEPRLATQYLAGSML
jgi:hypothetical protein